MFPLCLFLLHISMEKYCHLLSITNYILLAVDLTKASKKNATSIVQRLQRQSSYVLPRKTGTTLTNQSQLQRPIHRGTILILIESISHVSRF
jgi:ribose 1,5-bisphosphokinase PhnN